MSRFGVRLCWLLMLGCGMGCDSSTPTEPTGPPVNTNTITITPSGASPRSIQIAIGSRVLFINNDSRPHWMASDPHPEHDDCPEFDAVGTLQPGQQRETSNLVTPQTCGFHDHINPSVSSLTGQVMVR